MKLFTLVLLLICSIVSYGQIKYQGYLYTLQTESREPFTYAARTSDMGDQVYRTTYSIYGTNGKVRYTITADHYKEQKKIIVKVIDERYLLGVMNGKDETTYEVLSLKPFGFRGNIAFFDKSAPNQLSVQFISSKFRYVRVLNFLGSYEDSIFQYFIFRSTDKIVQN